MIKRIVIVLGLLALPFAVGLLFTYDILKIEWISMMEIQPSFRAQEDPLPLPARSVPIQGAMIIEGAGAPENPVPADNVSIQRGQALYEPHCGVCHGIQGDGMAVVRSFLREFPPANLLEGASVEMSDGDMFVIISNGIPGRMPAMRANLPTARDRWDVVNYVRSLQEQAGQ
jgi:mono/diheme cytochrome c family protein